MKSKLLWGGLNALACLLLLTGLQSFNYDRSIWSSNDKPLGKEILILPGMGDVISGKVTAVNGDALSGVSVMVKGAVAGAATDMNGNYSLEVNRGQTLVFSFIGYQSEEVLYEGQSVVNVTLNLASTVLDEVVAIGYGSVKKKDLTGAVSVVDVDKIENRYSSDLAGALTGLASGVKVTSSGQAGSSSAITIRGIGNLTNNNPLFVIDGLPTDGGMDLNLQDISSIQVLKDASAAAIYGSRAANGVVIVTTKNGGKGPLKINFSADVSANWLPQYKLLDRAGYIKYDDMAYDEAIRVGITSKRQNHFNAKTDWQNEELKTGIKQNYNLSLGGGSENGNYYMSMNKLSDEGTLYGTAFDRYAFRVNTAGKKGAFSYGENLYFIHSKTKGMTGNPFQSFITMPPTIPVYDGAHSGGYGFGDPDSANTYAINPIAQQNILAVNSTQSSIQGSIYGQVKLFQLITAKVNFGYEGGFGVTNTLRKAGSWTMGQAEAPAYLSKSNTKNQTVLLENTYGFKHSYGKHDIDAVAGVSYQHDNGEDLGVTKLDPLFINGTYYDALNAATGLTTGGGQYGEAALLSFLGRLNYTYNDKYLFSFTFRRDGSSRLPQASRWGNFPSVSAAWRISKESFFKVPFISDLKLRGSYGELGGANIGYWDYLAVMNTAPRAIFGPDLVAIGTTQSQLVNNLINWEKTIQTNIGVDASFLENKFSLTADYFVKHSKDLLIPLPILMTTGNNGGNPIVNAAGLQNKGFEMDLSWRDKINAFSYGASLNFTRLRNQLMDLGYGKVVENTFLTKSEIGKPLGSFFLYKSNGIFQSMEEVNSYTNKDGQLIQPNALPGDIKYDDYNGDGIISSDDRQIVGSPWPKFEMGLTLTAQYKNFDFLLNGFGRFGYDIYNGARATAADFSTNQNNFKDISPWTPENKSTTQPRLVYGDTRNSRGDQDRWLEDGSFFRIGELSLGYNMNHIFRHSDLKGRLSVTAVNLITFTNYSGLDPNFLDNGIFTLAADNCAYPNARSVLFSFSINF